MASPDIEQFIAFISTAFPKIDLTRKDDNSLFFHNYEAERLWKAWQNAKVQQSEAAFNAWSSNTLEPEQRRNCSQRQVWDAAWNAALSTVDDLLWSYRDRFESNLTTLFAARVMEEVVRSIQLLKTDTKPD